MNMHARSWIVLTVAALGSSSSGVARAQSISRSDSGPIAVVLAKMRDSVGPTVSVHDSSDTKPGRLDADVRAAATALGIPVVSRATWDACGTHCRVGDYLLQVLDVSWRGDTAVVTFHFDRRESAGTRGGIRMGGGEDQFKLVARDSVWRIVGYGWSVRS